MKDLFTANDEDNAIIKNIAKRAAEIYQDQYGTKVDEVDIVMDLEACHCNGCQLDLERMLENTSRNLMHDITGINRHLNRETGALEDGFLPRHAVCKTVKTNQLCCPHCQADDLEVYIKIKKDYAFKIEMKHTEGQDVHDLKRQIKKAAKTNKGVPFEKDFKVNFISCKACRKSSTLEEILKGAES